MDRSITFQAGVNAIPYGHSLPKEVYMIGWGSLHKSFSHRAKYLSQMKLNAHIAMLCNDRWELGLRGHEECADGENGTGLCGGDFGAPLVSNNTLIGIYQRGGPCDQGTPIVFTRVYKRDYGH
uniref:Peptidase S1 domain-containing protein n=1 Tax=Bracon brevicornis TaxID=1563983 RepID=A0A6V7KVC8_9HYME